MRDIKGKCAVITGGGSGIGRGLADALAAREVSVVIADILPENAERAAEEIRAAGSNALPVVCDVCDRASVAELKARANEAFGLVSLLVANAGAASFQPIMDMSDDDLDWILQVNLHGVINCTRAFLPDMYAARDGHVVATSAGAGLLHFIKSFSAYSTAKAGIIGFLLGIRAEAAEYGVGTTVLIPGAVESAMHRDNALYRPKRFGGATEVKLAIPEDLAGSPRITARSAAEVAEMVLEAVHDDYPIVVTDSIMREHYNAGIVHSVLTAFDRLERFDARRQT